jgi:hypothetical protein
MLTKCTVYYITATTKNAGSSTKKINDENDKKHDIAPLTQPAQKKKKTYRTACDKYEKAYATPLLQDERDEKQKVNQMNLSTYCSLSSIANPLYKLTTIFKYRNYKKSNHETYSRKENLC